MSKRYIISHQQHDSYTCLRDVIAEKFRALAHPFSFKSPGRAAKTKEEFWALKDVSFAVNAGDRVGIIGCNGAGKSTLLKVISRITEPTSGRIGIRGRVASLLEVGTGFHPELSGRENIYLNGAILGMSRVDIRRKFDEIVAFAEVEQFLDTPVKRYSSGMYVRLAFAVAAHLEPEILIVDEVLAVGDAQFQKKCLGKMQDVSTKEGRTVLFVSHNMTAIQSLSKSVVWLDQGQVRVIGSAGEVISRYLAETTTSSAVQLWDNWELAPGNEKARLRSITIVSENDEISPCADISDALYVEVEYEVRHAGTVLNLSLSIFSQEDSYVLASPSISDPRWALKPHPVGRYKSRCAIPPDLLNQGSYFFTVLLVENGITAVAQVDKAVSLEMTDKGLKRNGYLGFWGGVVRPALEWDTEFLNCK